MRPLRLYMEDERIVAEFSVYVENRTGRQEDMDGLVQDGIRRMEGVYLLDGREQEVAVKLNLAERFGLGAVNVRVIDSVPEVRKWYSPRYNVSRAYVGSRRAGWFKLCRFLWRRPDVFINLKGRNLSEPGDYGAICSVVQHEFGHVLGFRDQYRRGNFKKRREDIDDRDIMYRTGCGQRFMEYHVKRLKRYAGLDRLPFKNG